MFAFLSNPIGRALGALGILAVACLAFIVWLAAHDASIASEARSGYVLLAEKVTAEAKATEMERQRNAARQTVDDYDKRLTAAQVSEQKSQRYP